MSSSVLSTLHTFCDVMRLFATRSSNSVNDELAISSGCVIENHISYHSH